MFDQGFDGLQKVVAGNTIYTLRKDWDCVNSRLDISKNGHGPYRTLSESRKSLSSPLIRLDLFHSNSKHSLISLITPVYSFKNCNSKLLKAYASLSARAREYTSICMLALALERPNLSLFVYHYALVSKHPSSRCVQFSQRSSDLEQDYFASHLKFRGLTSSKVSTPVTLKSTLAGPAIGWGGGGGDDVKE